MKLLFCITRSDTIGGAHIHVADMAEWMISHGHSVTVVVGGEGIYCNELKRRAIPYRSCRYLQRAIRLHHEIPAIREVRRIFAQESPDLVSLHSAKAGILGRLASIGLDHKVVFTAHGWSFTEGVPRKSAFLYRTLEKMLANLADRIITVSEYDRDLGLRYGVGRAENIVAIHNAMPDVVEFAKPGDSITTARILMVARLDDQKDHMTLFRALAGIKESDWELDLVGDGPLESDLRVASEGLSISERVKFLGLRNDVARIMAKAHIFVLASNWEGFPRSILEAMRARLPVVASNVGGVSEAVVDGETGYIVDPQDVVGLRTRITGLLESPEERARMGKNARARYEELFMFELMALETLSVYHGVLASKV